jgi:hypothetical protein
MKEYLEYKGRRYNTLTKEEVLMFRELRENKEAPYFSRYKTEVIQWEEGYRFIILYGTGSSMLLKAQEGTTDQEILDNWQEYEIK